MSPMAELEGRYTLDSVEWNVDGITVSLRISETDDIAGELVFGAEGLDASYTLTFPEGETDSVLGVPWHATATTLTIAGEPVPYTWDGTYLEFSTTAPDGTVTTIKWRKR